MGDNAEVLTSIDRKHGITYPVLAPNIKGFEAALEGIVNYITPAESL